MSSTQPTPPTTPQPPRSYKPGDVANGHQLNADGTWTPVPMAGVMWPAPRKSHTTRNVLIAFGIVILAVFAGCVAIVGGAVDEASKSVGSSEPGSVSQGLGANDATADVMFSGAAAAPDAIGIVYLPVTVTNHSEKRSDYSIEIAADAADGSRVDFAYVLVMSLDPGQTTTEQAMFTEDLPAGTAFHVIQVQRTASL